MSLTGRLYTPKPPPPSKMPLFKSPSKINTVDMGPSLTLKTSRWRRLFRKRKRSVSISSTTSDATSDVTSSLSTTPSLDDVRIVSHVQEIVLREDTPESMASSVSTVVSRRESEESLPSVMTRDLFSGHTIFVDALDEPVAGEIQRFDTMKSVYVDALPHQEEVFEVTETMKVSVIAEVQDGIDLIC